MRQQLYCDPRGDPVSVAEKIVVPNQRCKQILDHMKV